MKTADATPRKSVGWVMSLFAGLSVLAYVVGLIGVGVAFKEGRGTKVDAGYSFSDHHLTYGADGSEVIASEPYLTLEMRSTSVAEGLLFASYLALAFQFLYILTGKENARFVRQVTDCIVLPLLIGQSALWARVADAEKVALIIFFMATLRVVVLVLDAEAAPSAEYERVDKATPALTLPIWFAYVMLVVSFAFLWLGVIVTNLARQSHKDNVTGGIQALSWVAMGVSALHFVLTVLALRRVIQVNEYVWHAFSLVLSFLYGLSLAL